MTAGSRHQPQRPQTQLHHPRREGPLSVGHESHRRQTEAGGAGAGIWFMPFAGTYYDPFFQDHQDWFVKRADGEPYETAWGGTCLDLTQAGAASTCAAPSNASLMNGAIRSSKWTGCGPVRPPSRSMSTRATRKTGIGDAVFANPDKDQHRSLSRWSQAGAADGRGRRVSARLLCLAEPAVVRRRVRLAGCHADRAGHRRPSGRGRVRRAASTSCTAHLVQ